MGVWSVGDDVGPRVGKLVGFEVGLLVVDEVGWSVGLLVGFDVGLPVGSEVGLSVGESVGLLVGSSEHSASLLALARGSSHHPRSLQASTGFFLSLKTSLTTFLQVFCTFFLVLILLQPFLAVQYCPDL